MTEVSHAPTWEAARAAHRWDIPADFSMAWACCDRWAEAEPDRLALVHVADGVHEYTFRDLKRLSSRLANVLLAHGRVDAARALYLKVGFRFIDAPMGATGHFGCDRYMLLDL